MTKFDDFSRKYEDHVKVQQALEGMKNPGTKAVAKENLVSMINSMNGGRNPLDPIGSPEHLIERGYPVLERYHFNDSKNYTVGNSEEIINEIPESKLLENLLDVVPTEKKGDKKHEERTALQGNYVFAKTVYDYLEGKNDNKTIMRSKRMGLDKADKKELKKKLIGHSSKEYIKEEVERHDKELRDKTALKDDEIEDVKNYLKFVFGVQGVPEEAVETIYKDYVPKHIENLEKEFNDKFKSDGERIAYAKYNLSEGVKSFVESDNLEPAMEQIYLAGK